MRVGACVHVCVCMCVGKSGLREHRTCRYGDGRPIESHARYTRNENGIWKYWNETLGHQQPHTPHTDTREVSSLTLHLYAGGMWNKTEVFKQALSKWEKQDVISLSPSIAICEASHHHHPQIKSHINIHTSHTTHYSHHTKHTNLTYLAICRPDALPPTLPCYGLPPSPEKPSKQNTDTSIQQTHTTHFQDITHPHTTHTLSHNTLSHNTHPHTLPT